MERTEDKISEESQVNNESEGTDHVASEGADNPNISDGLVDIDNTLADGEGNTENGAADGEVTKQDTVADGDGPIGDIQKDSSDTVTNNQDDGNNEVKKITKSLDYEGKGSDDTNTQESQSPQKNSLPSKIITVTVVKDGIQKEIKVEILQATSKKPFLGGFRHKLNKTEYLNASSQTYPKKVIPSQVEKFNRDTQTVTTKNQTQQTSNNTSTQMTKSGYYVSDVTDVTRIPGPYITADQVEKERLTKVILLQSYWRRWLASRYVDRLRKDRELRIKWEKAEAERKAVERAERLQKEFERRMKPRTKADFDLLYAALERWRREETDRINEMHSGAERKAALIGLLEQETYLIQSIERHRLNADKENYTANVKAFLDKAAAPKFWRAYDGRITEMNTQNSLRAQELRDLYNSLQMTYLTQDERLDVLLTLKHTVKEHDCKLTQELMELIDREADLLTRGMKVANLEGLRLRISTLFLQFCKTPTFNPDASRLLKVPQDPSKLRKDIYFCPSCNSYLPSKDFPLASNSRIVGRCKKCSQLDNNARLRNDFTKIRCIMQHLRRTEEALDDGSKTAFIIQEADLRYLIENIWNSQSALSGYDDLYDLVFIRWNKYEQWSPWNCVLLTKEEASAHMKLENVFEAYGRIFIGKVHHRHVIARQYFSGLQNVSKVLTKKSSSLDGNTRKSIGITT